MSSGWDNDDDDRARYERERASQRAQQSKLERGAVAAFAEWLGELAKQFVKRVVGTFWGWLRGLFE
jgi:hypothetical protein